MAERQDPLIEVRCPGHPNQGTMQHFQGGAG